PTPWAHLPRCWILQYNDTAFRCIMQRVEQHRGKASRAGRSSPINRPSTGRGRTGPISERSSPDRAEHAHDLLEVSSTLVAGGSKHPGGLDHLRRGGRSSFTHSSSAARPRHHHSLLLQGLIGLGHSSWRHCEIMGKLAHRGKTLTGSEPAGGDEATDLLADLLAQRRSSLAEGDDHVGSVSVAAGRRSSAERGAFPKRRGGIAESTPPAQAATPRP